MGVKHNVEYEEALQAILGHYAMPILLQEIDAILNNIKTGCMSVPLDNCPQTASMMLYRERMKFEGALAVKTSLLARIQEAKQRRSAK